MSPTNQSQHAAAERHMPLGVADSYRYWGPKDTIFAKELTKHSVTDVEDHEYRDFRLAYGPIILGYRDPRVDKQVINTIQNFGSMCGLSTELDSTVARRIKKMCPNIESLRFANSGTEAVLSAIRTARGFTGKQKIIYLEGAFHGLSDELMWKVDIDSWSPSSTVCPEVVPFGNGLSRASFENVEIVQINDLEAVRAVFRRHPGEIAAILIEPILGNSGAIPATEEYLKVVRHLCDTHGTVLIFDEIKTGFRVAKGGAQELYGVTADLTTYAKALANGYPIAAFGGDEKIMHTIHFGQKGVVHGGTYTANLVGLAAADATLKILDETGALAEIARIGAAVMDVLKNCFSKHGCPCSFTGVPAMFGVHFSEEPPRNYREWRNTNFQLYERFAKQLRRCGVLVEPDSREPWFFCEAHKFLDLQKLESDIDKAFSSAFENQR